MTFFTILGIIAFFFICKFFYERLILNGSKKEFERGGSGEVNKHAADIKLTEGILKWNSGNEEEALQKFKQAYELDPTNEQIRKVYQGALSIIQSRANNDISQLEGKRKNFRDSLTKVDEEA